MRVGVYTFEHRPEIGGGYTYGQEILLALDRVRTSSRHELVAIGFGAAAPEAWSGPYVSLRVNAPKKLVSKGTRVLRRFLNTGPDAPPTDQVNRLLRANGIHLIWAAAGGTPTHDIAYVATVWDLQHRVQPHFPEVSSGQEWALRETFYARELGRAARVIVGTDAGQREIQAAYGIPAERFRKLPHPTPSFARDAPASAGEVLTPYRLEAGFIFYPAQYWPHKNHAAILHALHRLRADGEVPLTAVFVGSDRGNEQHVRSMAESLGLADQVRFLGFVPREVLIALYRQALALVYPTFFGPENLPPLEAFALACPVIASRVAGSEEQLGDAAILVDPTDDAALARAIRSLMQSPAQREELKAKGLARARAYTTTEYVQGMLEVMDELEPIVRTWR